MAAVTTVANIRHYRGELIHAVVIDRSSKWGNPYRTGDVPNGQARTHAIRLFHAWWYEDAQDRLRSDAVLDLHGKVLLCHCAPLPCHGQVIADYVNAYYDGDVPVSIVPCPV